MHAVILVKELYPPPRKLISTTRGCGEGDVGAPRASESSGRGAAPSGQIRFVCAADKGAVRGGGRRRRKTRARESCGKASPIVGEQLTTAHPDTSSGPGSPQWTAFQKRTVRAAGGARDGARFGDGRLIGIGGQHVVGAVVGESGEDRY